MTEGQNDLQNQPSQDPEFPQQNSWRTRILSKASQLRESASHIYSNHLREKLKVETLLRGIQSFEPQKALEWVSKLAQNQGFALYGTLGTIVLSTFFLADLTSLTLEGYIPTPTQIGSSRSQRLSSGSSRMRKAPEDYQAIYNRNLFNSRGLIPGDEDNLNSNQDGPGVKTSLPFNLVGTLIMSNELRSVATIEDKSMAAVYPVGIGDEIPGKAKILKIEARRVTFINTSNSRKEYVEIPEDMDAARVTAHRGSSSPMGSAGGNLAIEKLSPSQFNVPRVEVDKALADLNNVLTQARAVPNTENGVPAGWKLFQIVPGSIYDKLGLQNGDVIMGLNGQAVNDPAKAIEMLTEFKTANHLELQVKKDGKVQNYIYDIR